MLNNPKEVGSSTTAKKQAVMGVPLVPQLFESSGGLQWTNQSINLLLLGDFSGPSLCRLILSSLDPQLGQDLSSPSQFLSKHIGILGMRDSAVKGVESSRPASDVLLSFWIVLKIPSRL